MPIVNPLIFYPLRAVEFVTVVGQWLRVGLRYHGIKKRVVADPSSKDYVDDATRVSCGRGDGERQFHRGLRRQDPGYVRRAKKAAGHRFVSGAERVETGRGEAAVPSSRSFGRAPFDATAATVPGFPSCGSKAIRRLWKALSVERCPIDTSVVFGNVLAIVR